MKRVSILLFLAAVAALVATACGKEGGPDGPDTSGISFTQAEGVYNRTQSTPGADFVELTFRSDGFDGEGNSTGKGAELIIPCYVKIPASGAKTIASGIYNPATGTSDEPFSFITADGSGARLVNYDGKGDGTITPIDGGSFGVRRSAGQYTIEFNLTSGGDKIEIAAYTGALEIDESQAGHIVFDEAHAYFYDDYYGTGTYFWGLDLVHTLESGSQETVIMNLSMSTEYDFDSGRLQEGTYVAALDGAAQTFIQGSYADGAASGSACVLYIDDVRTPYLIVGGTLSIEASGEGGYLITTDFELQNPLTGETRRGLFKFEGEPSLSNKATGNRVFNGDIESAAAYCYGATGNNSDRWVMQLAWPVGDETYCYYIEIYSAAGGGTALPTGTFNMAAATGEYAAGSMEPGYTTADDERLGTWFTSYWTNAERADPRPAKAGVGSITITAKGGGKYDIVSYFEDERSNKYNGSYVDGMVEINR